MNCPSTGWVGAVKSVAVCAGSASWGIVAVPVDNSNRASLAFDEYWKVLTGCCWKCVLFHVHYTPCYVDLSSSLCHLVARASLATWGHFCFLREHCFSQCVQSCFDGKRKWWRVHTWLHGLLQMHCSNWCPHCETL